MNKIISLAFIFFMQIFISCGSNSNKYTETSLAPYRNYALPNVQFNRKSNFGQNFNQNMGPIIFYAYQIMNNLPEKVNDITLLSTIVEAVARYPNKTTVNYAEVLLTMVISLDSKILFSIEYTNESKYIIVNCISDDTTSFYKFEVLYNQLYPFSKCITLIETDSYFYPDIDKDVVELVWYTLWTIVFKEHDNSSVNIMIENIVKNDMNLKNLHQLIKESFKDENKYYSATDVTEIIANSYSQIFGKVDFSKYVLFNEIARRIGIAPM